MFTSNLTTTDLKYLKFRSTEFHAVIMVVGFTAQHSVLCKFVGVLMIDRSTKFQ
jgi:hypothetical protein